MAASNYRQCLNWVLGSEGGWSDDPRDPGGATMKGITQTVYNAYRVSRSLPVQTVHLISDDELQAIYKMQYWDKVDGDDLPIGLDYCVFDAAVNSGVIRAIQWLQTILGCKPDGVIGLETSAYIKMIFDVPSTIARYDAQRVSFLERLRTWNVFGKGWSNRVNLVTQRATAQAEGAEK